MKYIIRALKYFCYLIIFLTLIVLALVLTGFVEADLSKMFINGYDSLWQIALIMLVFALLYPRLGYASRTAHISGSPEELRGDVVSAMDRLGYRLENEDGTGWTFRRRSAVSRALKMWEDRITLTVTGAGVKAEGLMRDLARVISALEATRSDV
jgi:hypothetical protein